MKHKEKKIEELQPETLDDTPSSEECTNCSEKSCERNNEQLNTNDCDCNCCNNQTNNDELTKKIESLENDNKALVEKVKLAQAELINYRRRKDEEVNSLLKYANKDLIMEIIPIVDNFERAIKLDDNNLNDDLSKFLDGFKMMYASLTEALKKFGVEEINRVGEVFDPNLEQALLTDHVDGMDDEVIIEVLLKGYKLKDRVIRPASVKINQN